MRLRIAENTRRFFLFDIVGSLHYTSTMKRVYLDFAATTPLDPKVASALAKAYVRIYGNAGSIHAEGVVARRALTDARAQVARLLSVRAQEIVFTSGGTESNNLAILGAIAARYAEGVPYEHMHIIVSAVEHSSVRACAQELSKRGVRVSYAPVDSGGRVVLDALEALCTPDTVLVSIMHVNNEIGVVEPVRKIAERIRAKITEKPPLFHVDASQSPLYFDVSPHSFGADLVTLDAHKMYGPKGIGALYVRSGLLFPPVVSLGGGQERGFRSGTEVVPLAVGFGLAADLARTRRTADVRKVEIIRDALVRGIRARVKNARIVAEKKECSPHIVSIIVPGLDAEFAVLRLDHAGFAVSSKSSCIESGKGSYVLEAIGEGAHASSAIRVSLGRTTSLSEVNRFVHAFAAVAVSV